MTKINPPTKTTNRIHFSDLDDSRFEDFCFMLLNDLHKWKRLEHIGRSGADGGVDIKGTQGSISSDKTWLIQCKRKEKAGSADLQLMVDKILSNFEMPDKILLIVSCDLSKKSRDFIELYCSEKKVQELEIWTLTNLETYLYANPKVMKLAFGLSGEAETQENIRNIKKGIAIKKRLLKALIDEKFVMAPKNRNALSNNPSLKFISDEVYIRSVNDTTYATGELTPKGVFNTSYRTYFYNTHHNGLEFWLSAGLGPDIIMDKDGFWEPIFRSSDPRLNDKNFRVVRAKQIGRIPYHRIVDFITDGDEFTSCPHLFCVFDGEGGMPYEEIYFKADGGKRAFIFDYIFDKSKQTIFPAATQ